MADNIKNILQKVLSVELRPEHRQEKVYKAKIELIMNSEVDFVLAMDNNENFFKKGEYVIGSLKMENCCYNFKERCIGIHKGQFFTLSIDYPKNMHRKQNREFVRVDIDRDILIFVIDKEEKRNINSLAKSMDVKVTNVKSIDISGGGLAFYNKNSLEINTEIVIDMEFISPKLKDRRQRAEVLRCTKINAKKGKYLVAVKFIGTSFAVQENINHYVFDKIRSKQQMKKRPLNLLN
ncbi:flagellar brake protein [Pectinatus sottacetonis]|uniref:flagellar brake protein n=1 Tax=Pectinatus sottacetonis TaxID=1002795 RepID=UPI0018C658F3|nr:PilZ domain-containing protein [Pectinatus sottacetonis]